MKADRYKVLMFGWEFPPLLTGGVGSACYGLTRHLALQGVEIDFVLPSIPVKMHHLFLNLLDARDYFSTSGNTKLQNNSDLTYSHLAALHTNNLLLTPYLDQKQYQQIISQIYFSSCYEKSIFKEVKRYGQTALKIIANKTFDIIHAHDWPSFTAGIEVKKRTHTPLVIHFHTTEFDRHPYAVDYQVLKIEQQGIDYADHVIVVSQQMKQLLLERYQVDPSKISVIYNAVEKGECLELDKKIIGLQDKKVIFFLGRITSQKGPLIFIEAAEKLLNHRQDMHFVMAGDGELAQLVKEEVIKRQLDNYFWFPGFLRRVEKEKLFAVSDLYVLPSIAEPFGITPVEVMRYNIPIIMTEGLGAKEIIPDAVEFKFGDANDLAKKIEQIIDSEQEQESIIKNYGKQLDRLDWNFSASKVIKVYSHLL